MDRFVALPVGQGDAFFLQHGAFTALVDGGRSVHQLPSLFTAHLGARCVDVLVCTHNDADHANGVLGFLCSDLRCNEVWLPALWNERLRDLLVAPNEFAEDLVTAIEEYDASESDVGSSSVSLEEVGNSFVDGYHEREVINDQNVAIHFEVIDDDDSRGLSWNRIQLEWWLAFEWFETKNKLGLFAEAMSAATRIRDIAVACAHRNVPIRWFQYRQDPNSSVEYSIDGLIPINSVQVAATPYRPSALEYISLSTANKLSLVFCSPSAETWPGVLFTADSDLGLVSKIPWREGMIVTAPHHGSEENRHAYSCAKCEMDDANDLLWVRIDSKSKLRPGASYCALPRRRRFCTRCRQTPYQSQVVRFGISGGCWAPSQSVRCCSCNCPK